jgi:hypothetical protein
LDEYNGIVKFSEQVKSQFLGGFVALGTPLHNSRSDGESRSTWLSKK